MKELLGSWASKSAAGKIAATRRTTVAVEAWTLGMNAASG